LLCRIAVEFATLTLDEAGVPRLRIFSPAEIDALLEKEGLGKKPEETPATA